MNECGNPFTAWSSIIIVDEHLKYKDFREYLILPSIMPCESISLAIRNVRSHSGRRETSNEKKIHGQVGNGEMSGHQREIFPSMCLRLSVNHDRYLIKALSVFLWRDTGMKR